MPGRRPAALLPAAPAQVPRRVRAPRAPGSRSPSPAPVVQVLAEWLTGKLRPEDRVAQGGEGFQRVEGRAVSWGRGPGPQVSGPVCVCSAAEPRALGSL